MEPSVSPSPILLRGGSSLVSLRPLKIAVQGLQLSNPLRIMVLGEPDEVPRPDYAAKVLSWYRLLVARADSVPLDGH